MTRHTTSPLQQEMQQRLRKGHKRQPRSQNSVSDEALQSVPTFARNIVEIEGSEWTECGRLGLLGNYIVSVGIGTLIGFGAFLVAQAHFGVVQLAPILIPMMVPLILLVAFLLALPLPLVVVAAQALRIPRGPADILAGVLLCLQPLALHATGYAAIYNNSDFATACVATVLGGLSAGCAFWFLSGRPGPHGPRSCARRSRQFPKRGV
ncbi:MAG: hypothetical protein AAFY27_01615 [Pseudomonadota bacterium]